MPNIFEPNYVYDLIRRNPQAQSFVETLARLDDAQKAAAQMQPYLNQFAQNPASALSAASNWAQNVTAQMQQPVQQLAQQPAQPVTQTAEISQTGGQQPMNTMEMANQLIEEFRTKFVALESANKTLNNNLKEIYDINTAIDKKMKLIMTSLGVADAAEVKKLGEV